MSTATSRSEDSHCTRNVSEKWSLRRSTWSWLVREGEWRRPRRRLYPAKPKVGIRADAPNELWHIDVTIIKLLDDASPPGANEGEPDGDLSRLCRRS